jgi:hypothetical protein
MVAVYAASGEVLTVTKPQLWAAGKDLTNFDLAPDGKRFALVQPETESKGSAHVTFLLNFSDELRRRAPAGRK